MTYQSWLSDYMFYLLVIGFPVIALFAIGSGLWQYMQERYEEIPDRDHFQKLL